MDPGRRRAALDRGSSPALDYFAPLELSFLTFYVAPVLFLVWFVGRARRLSRRRRSPRRSGSGRTSSPPHARPRARAPAPTGTSPSGPIFLVLFVWIVAELKRALERERHAGAGTARARRPDRRRGPDAALPARATRRSADWSATASAARRAGSPATTTISSRSSGRSGIAVGDVAGKRRSAAALLDGRACRGSRPQPRDCCPRTAAASLAADLNAQIHATRPRRNRFATFFWAVFDEQPRTLTLRQRRAQRADAPAERRAPSSGCGSSGPPLGAILAASAYRQATVALSPGRRPRRSSPTASPEAGRRSDRESARSPERVCEQWRAPAPAIGSSGVALDRIAPGATHAVGAST